jgi:hypothetical protein
VLVATSFLVNTACVRKRSCDINKTLPSDEWESAKDGVKIKIILNVILTLRGRERGIGRRGRGIERRGRGGELLLYLYF